MSLDPSRATRHRMALRRPNGVDLFVAAIAVLVVAGLVVAVLLPADSDGEASEGGDGEGVASTLDRSQASVARSARGRLDAVGYAAPITPSGRVVEVSLVAARSTASIVDGTETEVWAYNGTVPGPEIRVELGDTVRVELRNELPQPTSIHWHGIRVPNAMDGVPGLNQDPIPPGGSFVYEFTPPDAGTYWYHSHQRGNEQLERGLYGAIVVEDPSDPPYSQDLVWLIDDWLIDTNDGRLDPDFDSMVDVHHSGRWGNVRGINGMTNDSVQVAPGERIRVRMVNASTARIVRPSFGDRALDALVVAVDGLPADRPLPFDGFDLAPGNRVDVDLTVPVNASGPIVLTDGFEGIEPYPLVALEVAGEPVETPQFDPPSAPVPDWSSAFDWAPDEIIEITLVSDGMMMGGAMGARSEPETLAGDEGERFRWALNGRSWPDPAVHQAAIDRPDKVRFVNDSGAFHPMHLHGQFFQVVARNGMPVREGLFRDTVLLDPQDTVDVVVMPLDAGSWALHCHIQLHGEYGMMMRYDVLSSPQ